MKILKLRFINLNSLKGEWQIDFRHPAYANEGIFAITGTTGAGKSTILDAICLALYGATPRLGDITQNKNDIMSRQTGECLAEVVFSTKSGTYLACWSQKRAYLKPDGKLQSPKHEVGYFINDDEKSNLIEAKAQRTKLKIEEITGMDFGRFTRAMLLAQGSFALFLQADSDERSPILEQITGTSIYSNISKKVHEIRQQQKKDLDSLQDKLAGFSPLNEQQEQDLQQQKQQLADKIAQQIKQINQWQQCKSWRESLNQYQSEQAEQQHIYQQLIQQKQAFLTNEQRLQRGLEALKLEKNYQQYQELGKTIQQNQTQQQHYQQQSPILQQQLEQQKQQLQTALNHFQQSEQTLNDGQIIFQQVREFDYKIKHLQDEIQQLQQQTTNHQNTLVQNQHHTQQARQQQNARQQQINALKKQQNDLQLLQIIPTTLVKLENLQQNLQQLQQKQQDNQQEIQKNQRKQKNNQQILENFTNKQQAIEQQLSQQQQQQQALHTKIQHLWQTLNLAESNNSLKTLENHLFQLKSGQQQLLSLQTLLANWQQAQENIQNIQQELLLIDKQIDNTAQQIQQNLAQQTLQKQQITLLNDNILLQHKILSLESEREKLLAGSPCPLCGSTTHPYQQQKPILQNADHKQQLQALQYQLEQQQETWQTLNTHYHQQQAKQQSFNQQQVQLHQTLQRFSQQFYQDFQQFFQDNQFITTLCFNNELTKFWQNFDKNSEIDLEKLHYQLNDIDKSFTQTLTIQQQVVVELEDYQSQIDTLCQNIDALEQHFHHLQHQQQLVHLQQTQLIEQLVQFNHMQLDNTAKIAEISHQTAILLKPFLDNYLKNDTDIEKAISILQNSYQQFEQQQSLLQQLEYQFIQGESQLQQLVQEEQYLLTQLQQVQDRSNLLQIQLNENQQNRFALFADKQVAMVEQSMLAEKQYHFEQWQQQNQQYHQLLQSWQSLQENLKDLEYKLNEQLNKYSQLQQKLYQDFAELGFVDELDYCQSVLSIDKIQGLQRQREQLYHQLNLVENQLVQLNSRLQVLQQQNLTTLDNVAIGNHLTNAQIQLSQFEREMGMLEQQLQHNEIVKQSQADLFAQISQQKQSFDAWQQLYELIGSADGKKYRNFVQGLTFNIMIGHANAQLKKMSDRYLLVADTEQPLNLNVIDNYQAGIVRTSKNLSGGESFIISLALALGLSSMASHRMQVDSLFLDEGFGTLDEEALDTALDTLSGLQQAGKLIGVISHIEALKERISSKIQVIAQTGGVSKIVGEGICKLS